MDAIFSMILSVCFCEYCAEYNAAFTTKKKIRTQTSNQWEILSNKLQDDSSQIKLKKKTFICKIIFYFCFCIQLNISSVIQLKHVQDMSCTLELGAKASVRTEFRAFLLMLSTAGCSNVPLCV